MNEMNEKHLEFIQVVINRHNSNSFRIKGWAITISAAIFALTGTIKEPYLCFIALGPIIMFWVLDSMFLANERCFVSLYSCVVNKNKLKVKKIELKQEIQKTIEEDFKEYSVKEYSMNFVQFNEIAKNNWTKVLFSYTIRWFYLSLILLTLVTFFGLNSLNKSEEIQPLKINATTTNSESLDLNTRIISTDTLMIKEISKLTQIIKPIKKKK